jgi:hypothetical protein
LVGDFGTSSILRVALERVNGEWQGAVWPFARGFVSGVNRLTFGSDGKLYVGELRRGWASSGPQEFALERVSFSRQTPFEVREVRARPDGFELVFTQPFDPASAADTQNWDVSQFSYKFHATYGSPEINHEGKENSATPIQVSAAEISEDHRRVRLKLSGWKEGCVTLVRSKTVRGASQVKRRRIAIEFLGLLLSIEPSLRLTGAYSARSYPGPLSSLYRCPKTHTARTKRRARAGACRVRSRN